MAQPITINESKNIDPVDINELATMLQKFNPTTRYLLCTSNRQKLSSTQFMRFIQRFFVNCNISVPGSFPTLSEPSNFSQESLPGYLKQQLFNLGTLLFNTYYISMNEFLLILNELNIWTKYFLEKQLRQDISHIMHRIFFKNASPYLLPDSVKAAAIDDMIRLVRSTIPKAIADTQKALSANNKLCDITMCDLLKVDIPAEETKTTNHKMSQRSFAKEILFAITLIQIM